MLVVSQGAAQQAQIIEGQDQDHHAAKSNTANPPVSNRQSLTVTAFTESGLKMTNRTISSYTTTKVHVGIREYQSVLE